MENNTNSAKKWKTIAIAAILVAVIALGSLFVTMTKAGAGAQTPAATQTTAEAQTEAQGAAETETAAEGDTTVSQTETVEVGTGEITLNVYAMSAEVPGMITEYFKRNPDVASKYKVEAMVSSNDNQAYETKLNAALAAGGSDAPDLYVAEADYLLPYTVGELSTFAAPYADFIDDVDSKIATAEVAKYVQELGTNADGKLVALNYQCTGGAMIYRTDLAEEVLGAKTPEEV